ncbi:MULTISPECIES: hypothetical protein [Paenarthrobacter]|uniref:hypothetical protein n=1 Tax=Paenarthrobacter TaxID=1742992 RepID=UPI000A943632|nr:hypothetical protein [Paenarthrobacter nitroguajacolicus]NWL33244.1 hypothetical protein [Paenarthrobacter nitroguajacolicus]
MNTKPLVWLLLALTLAAYAVSIFISNRGESVWSTVSGVIMVVAALVMFWRYLQGRRAGQNEQ